MEEIRIGNTFDVLWGIFAGEGINEMPYDLTGKDISIYVKTPLIDRQKIENFSINKHIVYWRFEGKDQKKVGTYTMTIVENEGKKGMYTVDECKAFKLVSESCQIGCSCNSDNDNVQIKILEFRSKMSVGLPSSGGENPNIVVDNVLSESSENPVQNKIITFALRQEEERAKAEELKLTSIVEEVQGSVTDMQSRLTYLEENVESLKDKIDNIDGGTNNPEVVAQVEKNTEAIEILNADAETEGSVNNKIVSYGQWVEL